MTLDILGGLKNTAINRSNFVVVEEMLSNAIDAYLIRRKEEKDIPPLLVDIQVDVSETSLLNQRVDIEISCEDNGAGFRDSEIKAFTTKDSTYKDQLKIEGIGKCKGAGRIQFFHHFQRLTLESVTHGPEGWTTRRLATNGATREISRESFVESRIADGRTATKVTLGGWRLDSSLQDGRTSLDLAQQSFSCAALVAHLYRSFLQRLVVLKDLIGEFTINVSSSIAGTADRASITEKELPIPTETKIVRLHCLHGKVDAHQQGPELKITRYSFQESDYPDFEHEVALCANSAVVQDVTRHYLKSSVQRRRAVDGRYELMLVESEVLEDKVNQQRDGFDLPLECGDSRDLLADYSVEDLFNSLEEYVYGVITPSDFDRQALVAATEKRFGITPEMMESANIKIHYGDTEENIAKRVLRRFQEDIVGDTSGLYTMKEDLLALDPRSDDFRKKVNELAWKYTSTIKKMDMANLSQLVVRRSAMIEVLRHAVRLLLDCQKSIGGVPNANERIIHNVFFPMNRDSYDTSEHDIWLLNEEYQYYRYIASDKPLGSFKWLDGEDLFEADIDESLERLFRENNVTHVRKRPDIALFNEEGAAIIIELKSPEVEIQDHINDLAQYARLLAAKSGGRIRKFYGYLIGGCLDHSRMPTGWTRFPSASGYFHTGALEDPETGRRYGELYSELLFYDQFVDRADTRLSVYKERLRVAL